MNINKVAKLHEAPFVVLAHIVYKTKSGHYIRETEKAVGRCFSKYHGEKIKRDILETQRTKQVSFSPVKYINEYGQSPRLRGWNIENGLDVYEHITKFEIITKEEYIKRGI